MASLHGLIRKTYGKLYAERLVLDGDRDATPDYAPLGLFPSGEPANAAEGAVYFDDTAEAPKWYDGSAWQTAASLEHASQTFTGSVGVTGNLTVTGTILGDDATEVVAATNVITAAESGTTYFLNHATEFASTLPAPAAGLRYRFVVANAPESASFTIGTNAAANVIEGTLVVNGSSVACVNEDTITFADGAAVVGDYVELISDGTSWFIIGSVGQAASSITCSAT